MHVPALLLLLCVPNPGCFRDVKNKSGTKYNNAGFTSNKQTNKGNLLERRPRSIHAIRTLPLATLQTKINPPLLSLSGKYIQTFPSGQAPPEDGTSGSQQQIYASTSAEHWPAFFMDHSTTLECRLTNTSKLWFFPTPLGQSSYTIKYDLKYLFSNDIVTHQISRNMGRELQSTLTYVTENS